MLTKSHPLATPRLGARPTPPGSRPGGSRPVYPSPPFTPPRPAVRTAARDSKSDIVMESFFAQPVAWLKCVWARFDKSRALGLAAEMAFWLFLSLLPLAAVAGLITAKFAMGNVSTMAPLLASLPQATREMLSTELGRVAAWNGGKVGITAGATFVWLASSGVHAVFDALELESDAKARPWWKKRLLAIGACMALAVGVSLLAVLSTGVGWLWHVIGGETMLKALQIESSVVGELIRVVIGLAVSFGLVCGLYRIAVPLGKARSTPIMPGALLAVVLQSVIGFGYGFYIKKAGDGGAYQAGLASIGVTMTALYLLCAVLLMGAKVNEIIGERKKALSGQATASSRLRSA